MIWYNLYTVRFVDSTEKQMVFMNRKYVLDFTVNVEIKKMQGKETKNEHKYNAIRSGNQSAY